MSRRRRQNRKLRTNAGFIVPPPLAAILLTVGALALTYLWLCARCEALGKRIKVLELNVAEVRERRFNEEGKWTNLKSPLNIDRALRRHGLNMTWPERGRVVEIPYSACRPETEPDAGTRVAQTEHLRVAMND